jgi:hypothetical protein
MASFAVEEDLVVVTVIVDSDSVVIAPKSVPKRDPLLFEPANLVMSTEDDLVLGTTKVDVQHDIAVISKEVEGGVVDCRAQVEL